MSSAARQSSARSMRAVRQDVALDAGEHGECPSASSSSARIRSACASARVSSRPLAIASDCDVVGDGDVFEAARLAPPPPWSRGVSGRRISVVCMCRSPRRSARVDRATAAPGRGGLDLAAVLAQLGRRSRPGRAPRRCPLRSRPAIGLVVGVEQAVFVQLPAALERAIAQRDVVRLRAGEVLQRRAALLGRDEAQVGLEAAAKQHAGLGVAVAEHALDQRDSAMKASASVASAPLARMSRSPQVSAPRRRLPTAAISAPGACACRYSTSASAISVGIGTAGDGRRSAAAPRAPAGSAAPSCAPMPLSAAHAAGLRRRREIVEARDAQLPVEHARPSSGRRPAAAARRAAWRETPSAAPGGPRSRRSARSRECGRRGPCRCRASRAAPLRRGRTRPRRRATTMSAPLRYARILNGFSPFSSSRSAISSSVRATDGCRAAPAAWSFSCDAEPVGFDAEIEQPRAAGGQRLAHGRHVLSGGARQNRQPPPPAPQTLAALAPAAIARAIRSSIAGVVTPGARRLRFSHSSARHARGGVPVAARRAPRASRRRCRECVRSSRRRGDRRRCGAW